jgi:hypothetical protein
MNEDPDPQHWFFSLVKTIGNEGSEAPINWDGICVLILISVV